MYVSVFLLTENTLSLTENSWQLILLRWSIFLTFMFLRWGLAVSATLASHCCSLASVFLTPAGVVLHSTSFLSEHCNGEEAIVLLYL